jgi:protein tyrosine phosphatase/GR25 family glycosyltransferase involved in LPS biosynthesis
MAVKAADHLVSFGNIGIGSSHQVPKSSTESTPTQLFKKIISDDSSTKTSTIIAEKILEPTRTELPEAEAWFETQKLAFAQIELLAHDIEKIKSINTDTQKFIKAYQEKNKLTKNDGKKEYAHKTLHGAPFDHNRLGKLGEKEVLYSNGVKERKGVYAEGFENFYIAGSNIELPYRNFDLMQAPIKAHENKEDTVQDFWDTVVVLRNSPIIVTLHDPKEKIPHYGYPQRAEYWTESHFNPSMKLRSGWELSKTGEECVLAASRHSQEIRLVKRCFIAKHQDTEEERLITQFHYEGWPDHCGAPDHELLDLLHRVVDQEIVERNIDPKTPITAHCAAGLGRSATFTISNVLRCELMSRVESGEELSDIELNLAKTVYLFNKERPSVLGHDDQWQSVLLTLKRAYLQLKEVSNEEIRASEQAVEAKTEEKGRTELEKAKKKREERLQAKAKAPDLSLPLLHQANWELGQHFGSLFVITMKDHTDRQQKITNALATIGVQAKEFEFFTGVDGRKELPESIWKKMYMNWAGIDTSTKKGQAKLDRQHKGEAGCYMNHFQLIQKVHDSYEQGLYDLQKAKESGDPNQIAEAEAKVKKYRSVLILEDDGGFGIVRGDRISSTLATTEAIFQKAMKELPEDWQMLYFNALPRKQSQKVEGSTHIVRLMGADLLNAYAVNHTMYEPLIDTLKQINDPDVQKIKPVDTMIHALHPTHRCYSITPSIAYQKKGKKLTQKQAV